MTYDVPLRDIGGLRGSTGSYPWRLDGDISTIVSLTNVAPTGSEFVVQINYPGGPYLLNPRKLAAGGTATFDLRRLRDEQIPDLNGHTIPRSVNGGQFRWYIHGAGSGRLIGRAEMLSVSRKISSSYSCNDPCPPQMSNVWLEPTSLELGIGEEGGQTAWEIDSDGYGNMIGPFSPWVAGWSCSDTSVADMEGYGTYADFTALNEGFASTGATINYDRYVWDGLNCYYDGQNQTDANGDLTAEDVKFIGASTEYSSTPFVLSDASLNVPCGGERFVLHVTFRGPSDSTGCCTSSSSFVTLSNDNKFQYAANLITGHTKDWHPDDNPPSVDIGLRRNGGGSGTTNLVNINVSGTRQLGSGTYSGSGVVRLGCS